MRCERESTKPIASPPPVRKNLRLWKPKLTETEERKKLNWALNPAVALLKPAVLILNSLHFTLEVGSSFEKIYLLSKGICFVAPKHTAASEEQFDGSSGGALMTFQ